jgi:glutamate transport system permease protein
VDVVFDNFDVFVDGFRTTVSLTLLSAVVALVLGTLVAAMRVSPVPPLRALGHAVRQRSSATRPLTVVFFIVVFGLPEVDVLLSFFQFAVLALSLYTAPVRRRGGAVRASTRCGRARRRPAGRSG